MAEGRGAGLQHSPPAACGEREGHEHAGSQLGPALGWGEACISSPPQKACPRLAEGQGGSEWPPAALSLSPWMPPAPQRHLTLSTRLARGGDKALELHVGVHLHPQEQSHLQQDQLELPDTWEGRGGNSGLHPPSPRAPHSGGTLGVQSLPPPHPPKTH